MPKIDFPTGFGIASLSLTLVIVVLDKAGKLRGPILLLLLGVAALMMLPLALGNSWVSEAPRVWKLWRGGLLFCLTLFAYTGLGIWISEGDKSPFAVEFGTTFQVVRRGGSLWWFNYNGNMLSPIHLMQCLTLTNAKEEPLMISSFSVDVFGGSQEWIQMVRIPASEGFLFTTGNPWDQKAQDVKSFTLGEGFLLDKITNRMIGANESVRGWVVYGAPAGYDAAPKPLRFRLRIKDMSNRVLVQEIAFPDPKITKADTLQACTMRVLPTTVRLSAFKFAFFGEPAN